MNAVDLCRQLSRVLVGFVLVLAAAGLNLAGSAQDVSGTALSDFSKFRVITERNIFSSSRSGRPVPVVNRDSAPAGRVDSFTLVGTLGDGERWLAFFDGTRSELRGRLFPNDSIGGYTVGVISNSGVRLDSGTNSVQLHVGMQMSRENEGAWRVTERTTFDRRVDSSSGQRPSSGNSSASGETTQSDDEVLLRLKQKRERELQ